MTYLLRETSVSSLETMGKMITENFSLQNICLSSSKWLNFKKYWVASLVTFSYASFLWLHTASCRTKFSEISPIFLNLSSTVGCLYPQGACVCKHKKKLKF